MTPAPGSDAARKQLYDQSQQLFLEALNVDPNGRTEWVHRQTDYGQEVRAKALAMLRSDAVSQESSRDERDRASGLAATTLPRSPAIRPDLRSLPQLDNYEILEEIARGGMGIVYKARQLRPNRLAAIKMIRAGAFASKTELERFVTEAEAAAQLDDEAVVPVYELGAVNGEPFIAMKYIDGENLDVLLKNEAISLTESLRILLAVCHAVAGAHRRGIIHRDLKPSNILVDRATGRPWISDFGLAKYLNREFSATAAGDVMGTPGYMAPEQAFGDVQAAVAATDVYGLGAILYRLLTGRTPIEPVPANLARTIQLIRENDVISPRSLCREIPCALDTICMKCLETITNHRYPNAGELAADLLRYRDGEEILAKPLGWARRLHRWARHQPGLSVTWCAVGIFYVYHLVCRWFGWYADPIFDVAATIIAVLTATSAWFWQRCLIRGRGAIWVFYAWLTSDLLLLTLLLFFAKSANSPLVLLYHVVVAGSVLRCRTDLVGYVTFLAMAGYCTHLTYLQLTHPPLVPAWTTTIPTLLSLLIIGIIQYFSLRRSGVSYESQAVRRLV